MDRRWRGCIAEAGSAAVLVRGLAFAVVAACFAGPVHAVTVDIGPETIVMQERYNKPASFPHRRHQDWNGCTACHHARDQVMTIDKCANCHNETMNNSQLDSLRKACHGLCRGCHRAERAKGTTSAPSSCSACHPPDLQQ